MAVELGTGYLSIVPDTKGFAAGLTGGLGGPVTSAATGMGKSFGGVFGKIAGPLIAAVSVAALIKGTSDLAVAFDKSYDTIRVGTGATGDSLAALKDDFRGVVATVPADFNSASTAIADLNTRLGLTGKPLQDLSGQFLEVTRLLGGDLSTNIAAGTRVFGDWGVTADKQGETMDYLFKVSQSTGIGFDVLAQKVVQFGAPLRGMGFDFETATAMLGKFEKEGVNTDTILASLKIGLGKMAKGGITDAGDAFQKLQADIKGAASNAEGTAIAMEYFGARAGPDMALAIREGRLELGDFVTQMSDGSETIMSASKDTRSGAESWKMFKNNIGLIMEGPAGAIFGWVSDMSAGVLAMVKEVRAGSSVFDALKIVLWDIFDIDIAPLEAVFAQMKTVLAPVVALFKESFEKMKASFAPVMEQLRMVFKDLQPLFVGVGAAIAVVVGVVIGVVNGFFNALAPLTQAIGGIVQIVANVFTLIKGIFTGDGELIKQAMEGINQGIIDVFAGLWGAISGFLQGFIDGVVQFFTGLYDTLVGHSIVPDMIKGIIDWFLSLPGKILGVLAQFIVNVISSFTKLSLRVITAVEKMVSTIIARLKASPIFGPMIDAATNVWEKIQEMKDKAIEAIKSLLAKLKKPIDDIVTLLKELNPFTRHSPSLVDNIIKGVGVIRKQYESLDTLTVPAPTLVDGTGIAGSTSALAAAAPVNGGNVWNISGEKANAQALEAAVRRVIMDPMLAAARPGG